MLRFRRAISLAVHGVLIACSVYAAFWLRFDGEIPAEFAELALRTLPLLLLVRVLVFIPFRLFDGLWRYTSLWDLRNIILGVLTSTVAFYVVANANAEIPYPRSIHII